MRVSIVATALDGHKTENRTVLNMVSRIHNRNPGYSDGLFSQTNNLESRNITSIDGATALKLDEKYEINEQEYNSSINKIDTNLTEPMNEKATYLEDDNLPNGISIESTSYLESNDHESLNEDSVNNTRGNLNISEEEHTPKLFSEDEQSRDESNLGEESETQSDKLFEPEINDEEDFEIPAFLRKQKF